MEIPENQRARLEDMINYTPEMYFSDEELALVRATFNGPQGAQLNKVLRKIMLPTISDPELPLERLADDMFMSHVNFLSMTKEEAKEIAAALQTAARIIIGGLIQLRTIGNVKEETPANRDARRSKDTSK